MRRASSVHVSLPERLPEWVVTYGGRLRCRQSPKVVDGPANVCLIWAGDLRAGGWVTGSSVKASYERIMWYWELFHRRAGWDSSVHCCKLPAMTVVPLELSASRSRLLFFCVLLGLRCFLKTTHEVEVETTSQSLLLWGSFLLKQTWHKWRMRFNSCGGVSSW